RLEAELAEVLGREGHAAERVVHSHLADMRYVGQAHELTVAIPLDAQGRPDRQGMARAFSDEHLRTYGHRADEQAVECVTLRVIARVQPEETPWSKVLDAASGAAREPRTRAAYFGARHGLIDTPVV